MSAKKILSSSVNVEMDVEADFEGFSDFQA
jgi:hypothetical protein